MRSYFRIQQSCRYMMDYVKSSHNVQICLNEEMVLIFRVNPDGSLCIIPKKSTILTSIVPF